MKIRRISILLLIPILFIILGCRKVESLNGPEIEKTFSIYLSDINPDQGYITIPSIEKLNLINESFLTAADITEYKWSTHQITFPKSVHERLKGWGNLLHRVFVVIVNGKRIYWGKFMDMFDSGGCQNPVIMLIPRNPVGINTTPPELYIIRAYPDYSGSKNNPDIRNDQRIYYALKSAGILAP
jgi:hypothetical protein